MSHSPEEFAIASYGMKSGALLWLDYCAAHGQLVTRDVFGKAWSISHYSDHFGADLLAELERAELVSVSDDGHITTRAGGRDWLEAT
jgi:hypothetical protein